MTTTRTVPCSLPRREDYPDQEHPPEEYGDEWAEGETCSHDHCIEIDGYRLSRPRTLSRDDADAIRSDRDLMADEFHGRDLDGSLW